jgi:serine/threonine-protein kinase
MSTPISPGSVVAGAYRVVRKLGQGGMGAVWVVEHMATRKSRAMKIMLPELAADPAFRERFVQEAQVGARIESEHVVEVVDAGFDDASGSPFLVMELLEGEDLAMRLARDHALPPQEVQELLGQLAHALHAAHVAGIVHRDLKPENVFIARARRVGVPYTLKVLDFGIAKVVKESRTAATVTSAIGTPLWMAPEQTESSRRISTATDVWPFGLLAFRMLTGRYYWSEAYSPGSNVTAILTEVLIRPMVPASHRAHEYGATHLLPAGFDAWFAKCVDRDPAQRFQTAGEAYAALLRVLSPGAVVEQSAAWTQLPPRAGSGTVLATASPVAEIMASYGAHASQPFGHEPRVTTGTQVVRGTTSPQLVPEGPRATSPRPRRGPPPALIGVVASVFVLGVGGAGWKVWKTRNHPPTPMPTATATAAPATSTQEPEETNRWVRIEPATKSWFLGLDRDDEAATTRGLRPSRKVEPPKTAYELQQHEVTWQELEAFAESSPSHKIALPRDAPADAQKRAKLPATGVPFATAQAYCKSIGGALPSEEQWEYAARGAERRRWSWGDAQPDLARTRAFAGSGGAVVAVATSEQDRTPGDDAHAIFDLMGNAQEWTSSVWRSDFEGVDESWADDGGTTFRVVRGLPLLLSYTDASAIASASAAWRAPMCATGSCENAGKLMLEIAFVEPASATADAGTDAAPSSAPADAGVDAFAVRKELAKMIGSPESRAELQKCVESIAADGMRDAVGLTVSWSRPAKNPKQCIDNEGNSQEWDCCYNGDCAWVKYEKLATNVVALAHPTLFAPDSLASTCAMKAIGDRVAATSKENKWPDVADAFTANVTVQWIAARPAPTAPLVGFRCARPAK